MAAHEARKNEAARPRIENLGRTGGDRRTKWNFILTPPESPIKQATGCLPIHVRPIVAPAWKEVNRRSFVRSVGSLT
jgi:hypothetical protein